MKWQVAPGSTENFENEKILNHKDFRAKPLLKCMFQKHVIETSFLGLNLKD